MLRPGSLVFGKPNSASELISGDLIVKGKASQSFHRSLTVVKRSASELRRNRIWGVPINDHDCVEISSVIIGSDSKLQLNILLSFASLVLLKVVELVCC